ncbi:hypothetical protein RF679_16940 [Undibacterium cyanobacteriorum]|uniref:Uncharacterized protein n=1 Tax=Undibacterium cyanobacteriorum TaxID=3073561 RepID=A0ABY9RHH9_9BURK|nr:hypothetical protein [Undibacterium sp. 20NA77.5]WMW80314.1 hypothetical protein RF679_16940 [Undibacterium sp. 20NA77.5]
MEIAIRLTASTEPGDVLESLYEMLGRAAASRPRHFLQALLQENQGRSCLGVNFLGERFVDDFKAQKAEIARRKSKLRDVKAPHLKDIRDLCLKTLG